MGFFSSKPKPEPAPAIHSLLGKDVLLKGEIHTGGRSFRIEGTVEGTIGGPQYFHAGKIRAGPE